MNKFLVLVIGLAFVVGCTPDREVVDIIKGDPGAPGIPGAPGADGKDGVSCSASEAEGGLLISCGEDNSILLPYAQPGQTCSVERIDDDEEEESGALITCGDDDPVFIADGTNGIDGSSCSAEDIGDQIQISCEGSEPVYVADGEDGEDGISCKVEPTSTGANIVCGVEDEPGYSTTSITNGTNGTNGTGVTLVPVTIDTECKATTHYTDIPTMSNRWIKKDGAKIKLYDEAGCSQSDLEFTLDSTQTANGTSSYWFSPTVLGVNSGTGNLNLLKFN